MPQAWLKLSWAMHLCNLNSGPYLKPHFKSTWHINHWANFQLFFLSQQNPLSLIDWIVLHMMYLKRDEMYDVCKYMHIYSNLFIFIQHMSILTLKQIWVTVNSVCIEMIWSGISHIFLLVLSQNIIIEYFCRIFS